MKNLYFFLAIITGIIFCAEKGFAKEAKGPYCCCDSEYKECVSGDQQSCCTHPSHSKVNVCKDNCSGVKMSGYFPNDPNSCGNSSETAGTLCEVPE